MINIKNYFDTHQGIYATQYKNDDEVFIEWLKRNKIGGEYYLDIGVGGSAFSERLSEINSSSNIVLFDITKSMISRLKFSNNMYFIQGTAIQFPFRRNCFSLIHISRVFHHLVGISRGKSKRITENCILQINSLLEDESLLFINEPYYDGIIPFISSYIIFYFLKFTQFFDIKLPIKSHQKQLLACFYSSKELITMLSKSNLIPVSIIKKSWNSCGLFERICLLWDRGDLILICKKIKAKPVNKISKDKLGKIRIAISKLRIEHD